MLVSQRSGYHSSRLHRTVLPLSTHAAIPHVADTKLPWAVPSDSAARSRHVGLSEACPIERRTSRARRRERSGGRPGAVGALA